jgi:ribonuclease E
VAAATSAGPASAPAASGGASATPNAGAGAPAAGAEVPSASAAAPSAGAGAPSAGAGAPSGDAGAPSAGDLAASGRDQTGGTARKRPTRSRAASQRVSEAAESDTGQTAGAQPAGDQAAGNQPAGDQAAAAPETAQRATTSGRAAARRGGSGRARSAGQAEAAGHDASGDPAGGGQAAGGDTGGRDAGGQDTDDSAGSSAAAPGRTPPPAAFQPPLVIFQPPDISAARPPVAAPKPERQQTAGPGPDDEAEDSGSRDDGTPGSASRRRRRGGRGRGKTTGADAGAGADGAELASPADQGPDEAGEDSREPDDDGGSEATGTAKRRRRRRRTGSSAETDTDGQPTGPDDPPNTVVHVRAPREKSTDVNDVRAVKGSTRLEAKRQRRREGRESGRRRPPIITESEFLARREAVERVMVVRQHDDRTQIAVLEDNVLVEHYVDKASHQSYVGNVYLGKVQNVLPSMEAAFVDIGKGRNAVLYAGEVNFDASGLEGESKRIESALKSGQSILVQVTKDPIGHKGARLTSQVSLPGRYLVYVPGANMTGISRKLPDTERSRLKQILKHVMPENAGVIVRTAAEGASEEELSRDVARLAAQWEAIEKKAKTASAPDLLYSEPDLTLRVVRDIFNEDFNNLVIASDSEWDLVDEYVRYVAPHLADRMQRWDESGEVFAAYRIDEQLAKALERKVWLPSGGSLVIDHTEAMNIIDVNTGKFTGQGGNLEQTVTRNNLEAAEEIVRQLRLRDLGGIIVIDFIDMVLESNRELVLRRLLECLARDRTKHQVAEVTSLGLVQMTRKRVGSGLLEAFSVPCEHCNGRGVIISMEPVDHSHSRDPGRSGSSGRSDHMSGNGAARDGGGRDGGSRDASGRDGGGRDGGSRDGAGRDGGGRGGRGRGGSSRRDPAARESDGSVSDADFRSEAADGAGPSPAVVAAAGSRSRGRSRSARPAGPPDAELPDAEVPNAELADGESAQAQPPQVQSAEAQSGETVSAEPAPVEATEAGNGLAGDAAGAESAASSPATGSSPNGSGRSRSGRSRRSSSAASAAPGAESEPSADGPAVEPSGEGPAVEPANS